MSMAHDAKSQGGTDDIDGSASVMHGPDHAPHETVAIKDIGELRGGRVG